MRYPIYLTGFMGSGKSTFGRLLARELNCRFVDLDKFIEEQEKMSISEIFSKYGEERFREIERLTVHKSTNLGKAVIATGGGVPCHFDNMEVMNKNGMTIYLKVSAPALTERLMPARAHRPLIAGKSKEELLEFIIHSLEQRAPWYEKSSLTADTTGLSPQASVRLVLEALRLKHS
ncbi:shikimate kinase [Marinilabilia sp.]|uniref:shikimate kinase n=1 Tax=Marinilabilia sp. TaxID=2021252 RepID=UPI0025BB31E9|nr:shikimate kinase [Marinilabilia sp.]